MCTYLIVEKITFLGSNTSRTLLKKRVAGYSKKTIYSAVTKNISSIIDKFLNQGCRIFNIEALGNDNNITITLCNNLADPAIKIESYYIEAGRVPSEIVESWEAEAVKMYPELKKTK